MFTFRLFKLHGGLSPRLEAPRQREGFSSDSATDFTCFVSCMETYCLQYIIHSCGAMIQPMLNLGGGDSLSDLMNNGHV